MDLALGMLFYTKQNSLADDPAICWLQGDADYLPMADNSVDIVFSSMALQWSDNQYAVMSEIGRVMTYVQTLYWQLCVMCRLINLTTVGKPLLVRRHVNYFANAKTWFDAVKKQGL